MPLPTEILYYGTIKKTATLFSKREYIEYHNTPWGWDLDELIKTDSTEPDGKLHVSKKDGWTAVAFWDRSVDVRPGAWSGFLVAKDWTAEQVLAEAHNQWPEVVGRKGWPLPYRA